MPRLFSAVKRFTAQIHHWAHKTRQCRPTTPTLARHRASLACVRSPVTLVSLMLLALVPLASCERAPTAAPAPIATCHAELRSWIVAGQGRHLYLQIEAPPPHEHLSGRVEFTSAILRRDYALDRDPARMPRVARFRGPGHLGPPPFAPEPDHRLEATYTISIDQARCLQQDRVFEEAYVLVGANSNAGLRRTMESCGVPLPPGVIRSGGILGAFPGIDVDPGAEVEPARWPSFGIGEDTRAR